MQQIEKRSSLVIALRNYALLAATRRRLVRAGPDSDSLRRASRALGTKNAQTNIELCEKWPDANAFKVQKVQTYFNPRHFYSPTGAEALASAEEWG